MTELRVTILGPAPDVRNYLWASIFFTGKLIVLCLQIEQRILVNLLESKPTIGAELTFRACGSVL